MNTKVKYGSIILSTIDGARDRENLQVDSLLHEAIS